MLLNSFLQEVSLSRGPPKDHLTAKGCSGFVVEFNCRGPPIDHLTAKGCLGFVVEFNSRGPPKDYLTAKGCPGFVEEFDNYSITGLKPISLTPLL